MMLSIRDWMKRHRRSLLISVGILGAGYMCYQTVKYQKRFMIERQEREHRVFLMQQAEQRIESQLQVHFQSIQRISDSTTLPSILPGLKSQLLALLDLSRLTEELEQDKGNSRLSAEERIERWEKLKILCSLKLECPLLSNYSVFLSVSDYMCFYRWAGFTRAICCMWALTIAVLFVRVQFNILARHVYLDTARNLSNVEQPDQRKALSKSCQQKFILSSEYLPDEGVKILKSDVEAVVLATVASTPLRKLCSLADLREIFTKICFNLEHSHVDWLAYMVSKDAVLQDDRDARLKVELEGASHDEAETVEHLMDETRDILKSQEFKKVLGASFEAVLDGVIEEFESLFEGADGGKVPLAKLLPPISGIGILLLEHPDENRFIQSITDLAEVRSFCASVYSSPGL